MTRHWLMKAEPESRLEKGQDVAFSVDIFAACPDQISSWDGVRNSEAKQMMKTEMKLGDEALFYHSNCKLPGIAGVAKIVKEGYPDHTAWDPTHPYYDPKTEKDNPKWFMVDVKLLRKLPALVPLALLQYIASPSYSQSLPYLQKHHIESIANMQLLNRGRLSVQQEKRVEPAAFEAITLLGDRGGWQDWPGKWNSQKNAKSSSKKAPMTAEEKLKDTTKRKASIPASKHSKEDRDDITARRTSKRRREIVYTL